MLSQNSRTSSIGGACSGAAVAAPAAPLAPEAISVSAVRYTSAACAGANSFTFSRLARPMRARISGSRSSRSNRQTELLGGSWSDEQRVLVLLQMVGHSAHPRRHDRQPRVHRLAYYGRKPLDPVRRKDEHIRGFVQLSEPIVIDLAREQDVLEAKTELLRPALEF